MHIWVKIIFYVYFIFKALIYLVERRSNKKEGLEPKKYEGAIYDLAIICILQYI